MNIYVYSDESGVFDKAHNEFFVFGGLIILGNDEKEIWSRKYSAAENAIRNNYKKYGNYELKATHISNKDKGKLFRSLNHCYKFGVVITQEKVLDRIFKSKKDKQRYLDYVYKIALKNAFQNLMTKQIINSADIERIYCYVDEHTTATNGLYELKEGLEQEFKHGTYNGNFSRHFPPIFTSLKAVEVEFCNSASKLLVRAADIVANKLYYSVNNDIDISNDKFYIINQP